MNYSGPGEEMISADPYLVHIFKQHEQDVCVRTQEVEPLSWMLEPWIVGNCIEKHTDTHAHEDTSMVRNFLYEEKKRGSFSATTILAS